MNNTIEVITKTPVEELQQVQQVVPTPVNLMDVIINLAYTGLLCFIMYRTFKNSRSEIVYDSKFNVTLVMIGIVVTLMLQLVGSNLALSVGIMGSLSIVRFRTNTKDPRDLGFVFWAMGIGLASATSNWEIGLIGSIILAVFLSLTSDRKATEGAMLVVVRGGNSNVPLIADTVLRNVSNARLKAENLLTDSFEIVYEIKTSHEIQQKLMSEIMTVGGVDSVNMLAPSAEVF